MINTLKLTNGELAGDADRVMVQSMWAIKIADTGATPSAGAGATATDVRDFVFANMGKPTYPANESMTRAMRTYWFIVDEQVREARRLSKETPAPRVRREALVAKSSAVIGYGHPQGDIGPRATMASALNSWYSITPESPASAPSSPIPNSSSAVELSEIRLSWTEPTETVHFEPADILFVTGGAGGLYAAFGLINRANPGARIITTKPYYPLHAGFAGSNNMHYIDVMGQPGYRLTAASIARAIEEASALGAEDGGMPRAIVICDPNNPTGVALTEAEHAAIAEELRSHPGITIILDEAYSEMARKGKAVSLLSVAPDLADRTILMRSATKALSGAGERMAIIATKSKTIMAGLMQQTIAMYGHAPRSGQQAYALAMRELADSKRERDELVAHYWPQVELVYDRLKDMQANMPDPIYKPSGTFYNLANLSDLINVMEIPAEAEEALGHSGLCKTDEDIAYALMFKHRIAIAPGSYFGLDPTQGVFRITCAVGDANLERLCEVIESELKQARRAKHKRLSQEVATLLRDPALPECDRTAKIKDYIVSQHTLGESLSTTGLLLDSINTLTAYKLELMRLLFKQSLPSLSRDVHTEAETLPAPAPKVSDHITKLVIRTQCAVRAFWARLKSNALKSDILWPQFISDTPANRGLGVADPDIAATLIGLPSARRKSFLAWSAYRDIHLSNWKFQKSSTEGLEGSGSSRHVRILPESSVEAEGSESESEPGSVSGPSDRSSVSVGSRTPTCSLPSSPSLNPSHCHVPSEASVWPDASLTDASPIA